MKRLIPIILFITSLCACDIINKDKSKQPLFLETYNNGLINLDKIQLIEIVKQDSNNKFWALRAYFSIKNNEYIDFATDNSEDAQYTIKEYKRIVNSINCIKSKSSMYNIKK
jgi:hypothetical protein